MTAYSPSIILPGTKVSYTLRDDPDGDCEPFEAHISHIWGTHGLLTSGHLFHIASGDLYSGDLIIGKITDLHE